MSAEPSIKAAPGNGPCRCPVCGAPCPPGDDGLGCPVCLLQGALEAGSEAGGNSPHHAPLPPDAGRFAHYALARRADGTFEELGRGAMGVTYRAVDTALGRSVALKVIEARVAAHPEARERFLREARAAARLSHPNVASVFYYGVRPADGQCFYAMELVEGETLEARLRREGPLPAADALAIVAQVARALGAAEAQRLVHRDLKPSNVMLVEGAELRVKLIDFGLAKAAAHAEETHLTCGGFVGTPAFASPEQCAGGAVDVRSDLYALGATLWEMLTGRPPFRGSPTEVMAQHLEAPLPLEQLKGVPQPVAVLLEGLLEKNPVHRFQNAAQLLRAASAVTTALRTGRRLTPRRLQKPSPAGSPGVSRRPSAQPRGPEKVSLARLPVTGNVLLGREKDLAFLDQAWANPQVNVVSVVAWAGVGKSTLINHWLGRLATERYRSAARVFGWSFYRQGTSGGAASSADEFLDATLRWFDDPDPWLGTAWEKGERLARLVAHHRTLLVLDGLEPLQHPPGPQEGRLREPALQALLRELAAFNKGLCLITTRLPVADLADGEGTSALRCELDHLSRKTGAQLLGALGVKGVDEELEAASDDFQGHCLALTLLGSYLADAYEGDIRRRGEVSNRLSDDVRQGTHARRVMASYQNWFGEGPELSVLRLLGLFDRPADPRALEAVLRLPAIPGLTDSLTDITPTRWRALVAKLKRAKLLAGEDPHQPGQLDAHPLVREFFGEQLRTQQPAAWQEGNRRLYEHYRALAPPMPDNFRDMEPLFLAAACGCQAGRLRDALHEVYIPRVQRGDALFAGNVLGARGPLLSVLVRFFQDGRWGTFVETDVEGQSLTVEDRLFVLMQSALYLAATQWMGTPEVQLCYQCAEALCCSLKEPLRLYFTLLGQWRCSLTTDKLPATMQVAQRLYSRAQSQNNPALLVGAHSAMAMTHYSMGEFESGQRHATEGIRIWRSGGIPPHAEEAIAPVIVCLCEEALTAWHFGGTALSQETMTEAISVARQLNDAHNLVMALWYAGLLNHCRRKPMEVERFASEVIEVSTREQIGHWLAGSGMLRGWARGMSGSPAEGLRCIEDGLRAYPSTFGLPFWLVLKAEVLYLENRIVEALEALKQSETLVEWSAERWWCAELHRFRAVFLAALGADEARIEASFRHAILTARQQRSFTLAARAEESYAEYRGGKTRRPHLPEPPGQPPFV